jgi:hypothetical protein
MRSEDGAKRLTGKVEILDRWKDDCKKLLNKESGRKQRSDADINGEA